MLVAPRYFVPARMNGGHGMIVFGAGMCEYKHEA
jgi:hypothetical protein